MSEYPCVGCGVDGGREMGVLRGWEVGMMGMVMVVRSRGVLMAVNGNQFHGVTQ